MFIFAYVWLGSISVFYDDVVLLVVLVVCYYVSSLFKLHFQKSGQRELKATPDNIGGGFFMNIIEV